MTRRYKAVKNTILYYVTIYSLNDINTPNRLKELQKKILNTTYKILHCGESRIYVELKLHHYILRLT